MEPNFALALKTVENYLWGQNYAEAQRLLYWIGSWIADDVGSHGDVTTHAAYPRWCDLQERAKSAEMASSACELEIGDLTFTPEEWAAFICQQLRVAHVALHNVQLACQQLRGKLHQETKLVIPIRKTVLIEENVGLAFSDLYQAESYQQLLAQSLARDEPPF